MPRSQLLYLHDISEAVGNIRSYVGNLTFQQFKNDRMRVDAVVRNFEVIGEAVKSLSEELKTQFPATDWKAVAGFIVSLALVTKDPVDREYAQKALRASLAPLQPVAETVFAGRLDPSKLSWLQKWMIEKAKSPVGDFRDWTAIAAWARELPGKMKV
jgi:uncharacterized protein with HEPN domain